jgi:hypothetical protein
MAGRADIKAGGAYVELTLKNSAFLKGLRGVLTHLASFAKGFAIAGAAGISAGVAIGGVALRAFTHTGDELDKMRQRTGLSVETLSELRHAADQSGSSIEELEAGIRKMQREPQTSNAQHSIAQPAVAKTAARSRPIHSSFSAGALPASAGGGSYQLPRSQSAMISIAPDSRRFSAASSGCSAKAGMRSLSSR